MENLGIDGKLLLAQMINFVLFFFIVKKFIAKPFSNFINDERKREEEKQKSLERVQQQEADWKKHEEELRDKLRQETGQLLEQAKKDAVQIRDDILAEAKKEGEATRAKADKQIDQERQEMLHGIKEKVVQLSSLLALKALEESLTNDQRQKITQSILKNSSNELKSYEN